MSAVLERRGYLRAARRHGGGELELTAEDQDRAPTWLGSRHWTRHHRAAHWKQWDAFARSEEPAYKALASELFGAEELGAVQLLREVLEEEDETEASARGPLQVKAPITRESLERFRDRLADLYDEYHEDWRRRFEELITDTTQIVGTSFAGELGVSFDVLNPAVREFTRTAVNRLVGDPVNGGVPDRTFRAIIDSVFQGWEEGEGIPLLADRVHSVFGRGYYRMTSDGTVVQVLSAEQRARLIARTETTTVTNGASLVVAKQSGIPMLKVWTTQGDDRVRPEHTAMDGEEAPLDGEFSNGLEWPSEPNCRCTLLYEQVRERAEAA